MNQREQLGFTVESMTVGSTNSEWILQLHWNSKNGLLPL